MDHVFVISAFDPIGSAVALGSGQFVTNRHVVADHAEVTIYNRKGKEFTGKVVPTGYAGDLILFLLEGFGPENGLEMAVAGDETRLFGIGADPGRQTIRVYAEGRPIKLPLADWPLSRLHHSAQSGPGNSGGALVDQRGRLVGIITSGGEGRNEAMPASEIARLKTLSGERFTDESNTRGLALRQCAERIDRHIRGSQMPDGDVLERMKAVCLESGNRQLIDLAGQIMGRSGRNADAIELFERSLQQDPYAPNALVSLSISLHMARRYGEEIPHLKRLLELMPDDPQVLRLALQAGKWGGDEQLAEQALDGIERFHPRLAPVARDFLAQEN